MPKFSPLALARVRCSVCRGSGYRLGRVAGRLDRVLCECVYRAMFRLGVRKYHAILIERRGSDWATWRTGPRDYIADFERVARHAVLPLRCAECRYRGCEVISLPGGITRMDAEACRARRAPWNVLVKRFLTPGFPKPGGRNDRYEGLTKGNYWHLVYKIQQTVGRAMVEHSPPLFPLADYFRPFAGKQNHFRRKFRRTIEQAVTEPGWKAIKLWD